MYDLITKLYSNDKFLLGTRIPFGVIFLIILFLEFNNLVNKTLRGSSMKRFISFIILSITLTAYLSANVFMTELTDPQNSSDAGRYVELYNNGNADVDLSSGWTVQRWTNANADPTSSSVVGLTGTISAGGFYIICNDADKFSTTYGGTCDQDIGTGGFADSNGDDNMALLYEGGIVDMFGVAGEDGTGTGHEFEDGRAERADSNISASATWDEAGWNIDNDSGGGDGNQYAPEDFDPDGVDSTLVNKSVPCKIPNFAFINQNGKIVTNDLFQDKIYVANFFFTSCPSICPILTKHMKNIQEEFIANDDVLLLSHTVDPERDSVSVLNAYADLHGIMNEKWHLVTGKKENIYAISRKGYFAISYVPTLEENSLVVPRNISDIVLYSI